VPDGWLVMENEVPSIPAGRRSRLTRGNGVTTDFVYDNASRLTEIVHRKPDGTVLSSFAYTFDSAGNITEMRFANGDVAQYDYDAKDQLTGEHRRGTLNYDITFSYDPVGNRLTQTRSGDIKDHGLITYSYNAGDELLIETLPKQTNTYAYDPNGNTTLRTETSHPLGKGRGIPPAPKVDIYSFSWDYENRLVGYDAPGPSKDSTYEYSDEMWNRVEKEINRNEERYLYDGDEILCDYSRNACVTTLYVNGPGTDERLAFIRKGVVYYYLADSVNSVRQVVDHEANIVNSYDYEGYGSLLRSQELVINRYTYTGREFNRENGLLYFRNRTYSSSLGRFLSPDPAGFLDGTNLYAGYFPPGRVDPFGLAGDFLDCLNVCVEWHDPLNNTAKFIALLLGQSFLKSWWIPVVEKLRDYGYLEPEKAADQIRLLRLWSRVPGARLTVLPSAVLRALLKGGRPLIHKLAQTLSSVELVYGNALAMLEAA